MTPSRAREALVRVRAPLRRTAPRTRCRRGRRVSSRLGILRKGRARAVCHEKKVDDAGAEAFRRSGRVSSRTAQGASQIEIARRGSGRLRSSRASPRSRCVADQFPSEVRPGPPLRVWNRGPNLKTMRDLRDLRDLHNVERAVPQRVSRDIVTLNCRSHEEVPRDRFSLNPCRRSRTSGPRDRPSRLRTIR